MKNNGDVFALMKRLEEDKNKKLYLPETLDLANSLFLAFIKSNNLVGLKLAILFSGARGQITYDENNRASFNVETLCDLLQVSKKQLSTNLKTVAKIHFTYQTKEGGLGGTTPIHSYEYINRNKDIWIEVSSKAKSLFTELEKGKYSFNQANAANLMNLKHKHSIRMQLLLEQINNFDDDVAKRKRYTLEQLNAFFGVKYRNYYDFETKILKPVQKEINSSSKLTFLYRLEDDKPSGTGRPKIKEVVIDLIEKKQKQEQKIQDIKDEELNKYLEKVFYKEGYNWKILTISKSRNIYTVYCRDTEDNTYTKTFDISKAQLNAAK